MEKNVLSEILRLHKLWLMGDPNGVRADLKFVVLYDADLNNVDLRYANLCNANLSGAVLRGANLSGAVLRETNLKYANLCNANLEGADLSYTNLSYVALLDANLSYTNLCGADLSCTNFENANLEGADLRYANLSYADLISAKNLHTVFYNELTAFFALHCPESGSYRGYKKAKRLIVELEITEDALRSSATSRKCRANKARVISITDIKGNPAGEFVSSDYDPTFIYKVGETIKVDNFDTNRWNECSTGIHHFITRQEAVLY